MACFTNPRALISLPSTLLFAATLASSGCASDDGGSGSNQASSSPADAGAGAASGDADSGGAEDPCAPVASECADGCQTITGSLVDATTCSVSGSATIIGCVPMNDDGFTLDMVCVRNVATDEEYQIGSGTWSRQLRDTGEWSHCHLAADGGGCADRG